MIEMSLSLIEHDFYIYIAENSFALGHETDGQYFYIEDM